MFNLNPTETFKAPVKVQVATKSGIWREESFNGIFLRTGEDDRERLTALKNTELLREVLKDWEMVDEERKPVPFTPDTLEAFLKLTGAVREAAIAYWNHNVGAKQKKLIEAARWWAGVREDTTPDFEPDLSIVEAMEAMHAPAEDIEAVRAQVLAEAPPEEPEAFGVYADNLPTVSAFLALRTQWNYAGMVGQRTGFNYAGVSAWLNDHIKPRRRRALFNDLQVMERAVLQADHEQRKNNEE